LTHHCDQDLAKLVRHSTDDPPPIYYFSYAAMQCSKENVLTVAHLILRGSSLPCPIHVTSNYPHPNAQFSHAVS